MLFISFNKTEAQWAMLKTDADSLVRTGADYIYNVQFDSAEVAFKELINRYPDHPAGYFLQTMVDWWKITIYRRSEALRESFLEKCSKTIEVCEAILDTNEMDITGLFFKGGTLGYRARFYANNREYFFAASDGKEAYEIMEKAHIKAPGNSDIMLGTGIYNYFSKAIPEQYPALKPVVFFFPKGNKRLGILQLRASMLKARYTKIEAEVALMQIYYSFEEDFDQAHYYANDLHEKYPENPYFHRYLGRTTVKKGNWKNIENIWREILVKCLKRSTGYHNKTAREATYYIGLSLQRKREYEMAAKYLNKCIEVSEYIEEDEDENSGFLVSAHIKLGQVYDRMGKREQAKEIYRKVLELDEYRDSHKKAERYLEKPY